MAAPQFFVPPRVTPSRPKRRFTVQQADSSLPLVSRIVQDIVQVHKNYTALQAQIEHAPKAKNRAELEKGLEKSLDRLNGLADELANVGAELKGPQVGLMDFIGKPQGRDGYLC